MAKLEHKNLFAFGDKTEVYAALQRDYNRDTYIHQLWHFVLLGAAVGAGLFSNHWDWLWLFVALYAVERALSRYIDNSNRNWAMHVIDWIENNAQSAS
jgi:hypothetical protein